MKRSQIAEEALAAFVAEDAASVRLLEQVKKVAAAASTVLIQGESGTGKDLAASLIHYLGLKPEQPLVKIDCASLPYELMESELFGYERGAFTGATQSKRGRLELAGEGTLVLDEVASLSLEMQAKLLRVIEERVLDRLGGTKPIKVKARVIALSSEDLDAAVARRSFREDLFYRLNVVPLRVPALRERRKDIRPLAARILAQLAESHRRAKLRLSAEAARLLEEYDWPGNVRELRNVLERAVVQGPVGATVIEAEDLPPNLQRKDGRQKKRSLEELERDYIAEVLDFTRGKKTKAAEILGISRKNLLEKRKKYNL